MTVRIAPAQGSIVEVTSEAVRYVDDDGNPGTVDLRPLRPEAPKYVGYHDLKSTPCWVRLGDTRFEFETTRAAYEELVDPLLRLDRLTKKEPRFTIPEDRFVLPADNRWNYVIGVVLVTVGVLLVTLTDQLWLKWFVGAALLRAAYDGAVTLREKWVQKGEAQ